LGDRAPGANVRTQEGNNPDRQLRSLKLAKWETKLIESSCAEDVTGLSQLPKLRKRPVLRDGRFGRGALCQRRSQTARTGGAGTSENAGMSSANHVRNMVPVSPRFPTEG